MSASHAVVTRDAVALITAFFDEPAADVDHALDCIINDLSKYDGHTLVVAFAGILAAVVEDAAHVIDETAANLWTQYAQHISLITEQEEGQP